MRARHPLISNSPKYRSTSPRKPHARLLQRLLTRWRLSRRRVAGYRDELNHMLNAEAIYLGPGK